MQTYSIKWNYSKLEFFFEKVAPVQSYLLLGFLLILLPFISSNITIY